MMALTLSLLLTGSIHQECRTINQSWNEWGTYYQNVLAPREHFGHLAFPRDMVERTDYIADRHKDTQLQRAISFFTASFANKNRASDKIELIKTAAKRVIWQLGTLHKKQRCKNAS